LVVVVVVAVGGLEGVESAVAGPDSFAGVCSGVGSWVGSGISRLRVLRQHLDKGIGEKKDGDDDGEDVR
jgi:hypothetical protein